MGPVVRLPTETTIERSVLLRVSVAAYDEACAADVFGHDESRALLRDLVPNLLFGATLHAVGGAFLEREWGTVIDAIIEREYVP